MKRPERLHLAGPGTFTQVEDAAALIGQDGSLLQLSAASRLNFTWGPAFGEAGKPVALPGHLNHHHGLRLTALQDGWVAGGGAVFTRDGGIILDGLAPYAHEVEANPARFVLLLRLYGIATGADGGLTALPCAVHRIEEPVFHLLCEADNAFTHFLIDTLPKLALWDALPEPRPRPLVSAMAWKRWRGFLLATTGLPEAAFIVHHPRTILHARQIYVASFPRWNDARAVAPLRRASAGLPTGQRRILVVRRDAWAWDRMLLNEREVVALLRKRGFEPVVTSSMTPSRQFELFRSACLVAGALGGGLLNSIFSAPGTGVLSILSPDYTRPLIDSSAHITGLRVAHAVGDSFSASRDRNNSPYLVDPAALDAALEALGAD